MAIERHAFTSWNGLRTWMSSHLVHGAGSTTEATDYFGWVEFTDGYTNRIICYEDGENEKQKPIVEFGYIYGGVNEYVKIYKTNTDSLTVTSTYTGYFNQISAVAWVCNGGVYIEVIDTASSGSPRLRIIITKTNNGVTAVIASIAVSEQSAAALKTDVAAACRGDDTSEAKKLTFTSTKQNQTELVPFTTYSQFGTVSYTPNAYYCPVAQYAVLYTGNGYVITYNGINYVTNGLWAIKDVPTA